MRTHLFFTQSVQDTQRVELEDVKIVLLFRQGLPRRPPQGALGEVRGHLCPFSRDG